MNKLQNAVELWDSGDTSPFNPPTEDIVAWLDEFFSRTGAKKRVATRWTFQDHVYEDANCPIPIPDMSALVYAVDGWKYWVVLNPDGTKKFTINVPKVNEQSVPELGELGEPRYRQGDPPNIMYGEGSDGYRSDCRFFFDMHTGECISVQFVGRHW